MTFLDAVARQEGFYASGTRPARNNNPGDLEYHPWMSQFGSKGGDPRFAIFPTPEQGFAALKELFTFHAYKGKTVAEAINTFAPGNENDTALYIHHICLWVGCLATDIIDDLLEAA